MVVSDGLIEQDRILWNERYISAETSPVDAMNVPATHQDRSCVRVVQAGCQKANRALSRAIQAHQCHRFLGLNAKAHLAQHWPVLGVSKPDRTEFQVGPDVRLQRR